MLKVELRDTVSYKKYLRMSSYSFILIYNSLFILRIIQNKISFEILEPLRKRHTAYTNLDENIE